MSERTMAEQAIATSQAAAGSSSFSKPGPQMGERLTLEEMVRRDMERAIAHSKMWDDIFSQLFDPKGA